MNGKFFTVFVVFALLAVSANAASWQEVSKGVSTFIYGIDFTSQSQGWLCGFNLISPFGAQILQTNNSGSSFIAGSFSSGAEGLEFMAIDFNSNYGVAVGSGVSFLPGVSVTTDGQNWATPSTDAIIEATFLDVNTFPGQSAVVIGNWKTALGDHTGFLSSNNGGKFQGNAWPYSLSARYGSFMNTTYGWVAGGNKSNFVPKPVGSVLLLDDEYLYDSETKEVRRYDVKERSNEGDYQGIIAVTADGGRKFDVLYNSTAEGLNLYFNGIQFVDDLNGWAVAVEYNYDSNATFSHIFNTNDGGQTWNIQFSEEHVRLFRVRMFDSQNGWAVGWKLPSLTLFTGEFYRTTDGGKRWTKNNIRDVIGLDVSNISGSSAYAVAFGLDFSTNLYYYS